MVTVLFAETGDAQASMDQTMEFIATNIDAFNETVQRLQSPKHWISAKWASEVNDLIKTCQFCTMGNIMWG